MRFMRSYLSKVNESTDGRGLHGEICSYIFHGLWQRSNEFQECDCLFSCGVIAYIIILSKTDRINYIQYHSNRVIFIILIILVYIVLYFAQSK
jgi:hypothetical protein